MIRYNWKVVAALLHFNQFNEAMEDEPLLRDEVDDEVMIASGWWEVLGWARSAPPSVGWDFLAAACTPIITDDG